MTRPEPDAQHLNESDRNRNPDLGDADAVEKTTFVGDVHGTEPGAATDQKPRLEAAVRAGGGLSPLAWIALVGGLLALLAYAVGIFT